MASGHTTTSDNLQTWILRVYIHCEGCKKKVFKVLQSINGVYKTVIDAKEHKATVTGSVNGEVLVQKLLKSGKHAEILPESFAATAAAGNESGNLKKKKKKKQNDVVKIADDAEQVNGEKTESKGSTGKNIQEIADPDVTGLGGKKKKSKKKAGKNDNNAPTNDETDGLPMGDPATGTGVPVENAGDSMGQLNLGVPTPQTGYSAPYGLPPYHNYYPTPAYGVQNPHITPHRCMDTPNRIRLFFIPRHRAHQVMVGARLMIMMMKVAREGGAPSCDRRIFMLEGEICDT